MDGEQDYWFVDLDEEGLDLYPWMIFLRTGGCTIPLDLNFDTKERAEEFMAQLPTGTVTG